MPTAPPPPAPGPPPIQIPAGCEAKLTGEWQLEDDPSFRYHFEDDGSESTVWVYRVFAPPDAGVGSRLFPRQAHDAGVPARDAGTLRDGGVDLVAARMIRADELFEKEGYEESAKVYLEVASQDPKRDLAPIALEGAATANEKARRFADAAAAWERIVHEYPKFKRADGALFHLALLSEQASDFQKAIDSYQKLLKDYPQSAERATALLNLAGLFEGTHRDAEASATLARYLEQFPKTEAAPKAQLHLAELYDRQQDYPKEIAALGAVIKQYTPPATVIDAKRRIAEVIAKQNKASEARKAFAAAADEFDRRALVPAADPAAAEAAAFCAFQAAEYDAREIEKVTPAAAKLAAAKKAQFSYQRVLKYQRGPWSELALSRKAELLEAAVELSRVPVPPAVTRLGADAVAIYEARAEELRGKLIQAAVQAYQQVLQSSAARKATSDATRKAQDALHRLRPDAYPAQAEALISDAGTVLDAGVEPDAGRQTDAGSVAAGDAFDGGVDLTHHHPLPADLIPRDGGTPPLATAVIHLRRGPDGFHGEAETIRLLPSGRECRATFPTRVAACGPSTLTMVSASSTPMGDGCQTPALPRPAALLEHRLARTAAGEL